eukprot:CAMPEP_0178440088 /NCGR_PEP_ID=MMETSP0689_2-20121128/36550_1 /TAXON_ID=160604 /ORGANISM="Amphidinium massartii, Strain CS-259" /LENGTH=108 /DNA_ID=CAMNT_0020062755 /DNA_START=86 /DNA_END=412 /DNA_ORIENTATION=-
MATEMTTLKVTVSKPTNFYSRAAATFLRGTTDKPPVTQLQISALGNAIGSAVTVATRLEKDGLANIEKVQTSYPDMPAGVKAHGCAQILIEVKGCPSATEGGEAKAES